MTLIHADCLEAMAAMEPESVDAIVTDPPYGLGFMGKTWDDAARLASVPPSAVRLAESGRDPYPKTGKGPSAVAFDGRAFQSWCRQWAEAAYRVAKPSAYLLAFGGTRTVHRMTVALEDAGWIIRDMLVWAYASGFPKSKASLKPAWEPIVMARKPGPLRMLAIDECRIGWGADQPTQEEWNRAGSSGKPGANGYAGQFSKGMKDAYAEGKIPVPSGRWPANVILTDPIFDGGVEGVVGGGEVAAAKPERVGLRGGTAWHGMDGFGSPDKEGRWPADPGGTYSRFFLIPKADRSDREPIIGRDGIERVNVHPTVKSTDLMRHLVRLVTPTGGTVLDPFLGSGTTGLAAEMEGFEWIGIEREAEYIAIAEARLNGTQRGLGLETA